MKWVHRNGTLLCAAHERRSSTLERTSPQLGGTQLNNSPRNTMAWRIVTHRFCIFASDVGIQGVGEKVHFTPTPTLNNIFHTHVPEAGKQIRYIPIHHI